MRTAGLLAACLALAVYARAQHDHGAADPSDDPDFVGPPLPPHMRRPAPPLSPEDTDALRSYLLEQGLTDKQIKQLMEETYSREENAAELESIMDYIKENAKKEKEAAAENGPKATSLAEPAGARPAERPAERNAAQPFAAPGGGGARSGSLAGAPSSYPAEARGPQAAASPNARGGRPSAYTPRKAAWPELSRAISSAGNRSVNNAGKMAGTLQQTLIDPSQADIGGPQPHARTAGAPGTSPSREADRGQSRAIQAAFGRISPAALRMAGLNLRAQPDGTTDIVMDDGRLATMADIARLQQIIASGQHARQAAPTRPSAGLPPKAASRIPGFLDPARGIAPERFQDLRRLARAPSPPAALQDIELDLEGRDLVWRRSCSGAAGDCNPHASGPGYARGEYVPPQDLNRAWTALAAKPEKPADEGRPAPEKEDEPAEEAAAGPSAAGEPRRPDLGNRVKWLGLGGLEELARAWLGGAEEPAVEGTIGSSARTDRGAPGARRRPVTIPSGGAPAGPEPETSWDAVLRLLGFGLLGGLLVYFPLTRLLRPRAKSGGRR
ncbi:MAG: hypothetical protein HY553_20235 [Elusimicrobia bacterium]|nr:hypothetical protein [Elusimicrobiota bacterium]